MQSKQALSILVTDASFYHIVSVFAQIVQCLAEPRRALVNLVPPDGGQPDHLTDHKCPRLWS